MSMDTQFDWLASLQLQPPPPPVSFGSASAERQNTGPDNTTLSPETGQQIRRDSSSPGLQAHAAPGPSANLESVPLSLKPQDLSPEESRTYIRWYLDILARAHLRTIAISDVYQFLGNFRLSPDTRAQINRIFARILSLINIGEFFAVLRVVAHALQGHEPARALIQLPTGVPLPPSILLKKRPSDDVNDSTGLGDDSLVEPMAPAAPLDIDLFTQFMLTGERPHERKAKGPLKKRKSVKFSDEVVSNVCSAPDTDTPPNQAAGWDELLPMDQLLSRMQAGQLSVPQRDAGGMSPDSEERQILHDMAPQINHFQHLHSVDTMLVDGVPANLHLPEHSGLFLPRNSLPQPPQPQLLKPNMTGPAQMAQMQQSSSVDPKPLRPNVTGPLDMARFLEPLRPQAHRVSLQAFTSQMTGNTVDNTVQNARIGANFSPVHLLSPPPVPATRRNRSASSPTPSHVSWDAQGRNESHLYSQHEADPPRPGPPVPARSPLGQTQKTPPPPPPPPRSRRVGSMSSQIPPPLPAKIPNDPVYQVSEGSSSTTNILDDLKALQEEVDKIRDLTGGF